MKAKPTLVILTVATLAFAGGAALTSKHWSLSHSAYAAADSGDPQHKEAKHHKDGKRGHHAMGRICSPKRQARIDNMVSFMENFADFTPEQSEAWTALTTSLDDSNARIDATCAELKDAERPKTAPERLARMELMLSTALAAVQEVRPTFDTFYASLDQEQQQALDKMTKRHRGLH